jgi:hypothetical protein
VLRADLVAIVGDGTPRVVGTPGAAAGRDRIAGILESLGLRVERQRTRIERRAGAVDLENLVAAIDGTGADAGPAIAVVAHSDSVVGSPGASDDGAGVAALCAVARALVARPPVHGVLLVVTDGEERGLLGAQAFMAQHAAASGLRAVVNLDARGAAGPAAIFELGPESAWLADLIADFVPAPRTQSLAAAIYERMPNGTDFTVFLEGGATGFNVAFIGDVAAYHRPEDTVERQSPWTREHMAQTALGLVRGIDARWPEGGVGPSPAACRGRSSRASSSWSHRRCSAGSCLRRHRRPASTSSARPNVRGPSRSSAGWRRACLRSAPGHGSADACRRGMR